MWEIFQIRKFILPPPPKEGIEEEYPKAISEDVAPCKR